MRTRNLVTGAAFSLAITAGHAVAQQDRAPSFQPAPCDLPGLTPELAPRLQCGTVAVPRERKSQDAGKFNLAVVIIKAETSQKQPDPVLYLAGGPGSPLTSRAVLIAKHEAQVIAPDRDLILVDQRGAGRSEPPLCPGLAGQQLAIFASGSEQTALVRAWRDSYRGCRREMAADGLQPQWFGTR